MIKIAENPKVEFTNERLTYFTKFTIQHVIYVVKQSVSPEMFTNERLFTIQRRDTKGTRFWYVRILMVLNS